MGSSKEIANVVNYLKSKKLELPSMKEPLKVVSNPNQNSFTRLMIAYDKGNKF